MIEQNLSTLRIHKLSQAQYDNAKANGNLEENAIYITPEDDSRIDEIEENLNLTSVSLRGHIDDKENPHDVGLDDLAGIEVSEDEVNSLKGINGNVQEQITTISTNVNNNKTETDQKFEEVDAALDAAGAYTDEQVAILKDDDKQLLADAKAYADQKVIDFAGGLDIYTKSQVDTLFTDKVGEKSVSTQIGEHNTNTESHGDIRNLIADLTTRLNALANSTDTDLDQMAELVDYIKANRDLIESVTTSKISVDAIVDNLTSVGVTNKPLSANQGAVLSNLINDLTDVINTHKTNVENEHATIRQEFANADSTLKTELNAAISGKVDKISGKSLSTNDYTTEEKNKLAGIAAGANAYTLPAATSSALGGVKIGYTATGKNYPVALDANGRMYVNVPWTDNNTTYTAATTTTDGLMSAADKSKLNGIATGANNYVHPTSSGYKHIPTGGGANQVLIWSADGTATWGYHYDRLFDTRDANKNPQWYYDNYAMQIVHEFKSTSVLGLSGETYCYLETIVPWNDATGGYPKQTAFVNNRKYTRVGTSTTTWGAWRTDMDTDTKVTNTLATTTKAYITGTTSASTNTGTQVFDTGVYLDTTAGRLAATSFKIGEGCNLIYDSTNKCVSFAFI